MMIKRGQQALFSTIQTTRNCGKVPARAQGGLIQVNRMDFVVAMNADIGHVEGQLLVRAR